MKAIDTLDKLKPSESSTIDISKLKEKCYEAINDDLNSPILLSYLFEGVKYINSVNEGIEKLSAGDIEALKSLFKTFVIDILGLKDESSEKSDEKFTGDLINMILNMRQDAKNRKDWPASDKIREDLTKLGITIKDKKDGTDWERS
jgi:cysteinyl-tRNA synthetase